MKCGPIYVVLAAAGIAACSMVYAQSPLPISGGGTGATTGSAAIANLGLPTISVTDFGATGNGSTDDTTAISNAMNACATRAFPFNGCNLYFPSGIYITTGITLQSYVHITGDGWATSVIMLKPSTSADVLTVPASTFDFSIVGVTLDGNSSNAGVGNCLTVQTNPNGPNFINTSNKQTESTNGYKLGYIAADMFSNCSNYGVNILPVSFELWFDDFYVYNNGVYGIFTQGTDSLFSNFVSEHNGTSGVYVSNSNNKFINAKVIWNGFTNTSAGAVFTNADRNIFTDIETQDNYVSGFVDQGSDNQFIGCQADTNGYANTSNNSSSLTASGFVISGTNGVYIGDKVTDYRGKLSDGNFATEWPYTINNTQQSRVDISYDGTNQPPPTVAGDIVVSNNVSMLPPTGTATSAVTDASSEPLDFRGSFWNGTVAVSSDWRIQHLLQSGFDNLAFMPPAPGTSPGSQGGAISFPQLQTATASSGNFNSVPVQIQSSVWNGSAPIFPGWQLQTQVGAGTNPNSSFSILPYNSTGIPQIDLNANTEVFGNENLTGNLQWGGGPVINNSTALPQVGTPTAGHMACIKSAGPPVVIGYCSTSATSSGTCTCN
jgi:Pectate lyase superfamily protein